MNENQNVVSIRELPIENKTEKELLRTAQLARKMRRQELRLRATIAKLKEAGFAIAARGLDGSLVPIEQVEITLLKLTK